MLVQGMGGVPVSVGVADQLPGQPGDGKGADKVRTCSWLRWETFPIDFGAPKYESDEVHMSSDRMDEVQLAAEVVFLEGWAGFQ